MSNARSLTVEDENGVEHTLRTKFEVCDRCEGKDVHDHEAFANGITGSEWAEWDGDEQESYLRGAYDVRCSECDGLRVVPVVDEDANPAELVALYYERLQFESDCRAEEAAERRMGC